MDVAVSLLALRNVPLLLLVVLLPLIVIALMPVILIQRYRVGTARRLARPWLTTLNVAFMTFSVICFLLGAAVTAVWVPNAFTGAAAGVAVGMGLGLIGLMLTRWERAAATLHYTPNRWLVLLVTLVVTGRILFGLYRTLLAAESGLAGRELVTAFGVAESLGAGGVVIGYYLAYNAGVVWKIRRWERRPLRPA